MDAAGIGDALDALLASLASTSPEAREEAIVQATRQLPSEVLVALVRAATAIPLRSVAMLALARRGNEAAPQVREGALAGGRGAMFCLQLLGGYTDEEGFQLLCRVATEGDLLHRQAAVDALGQRRDERAVPILRRALEDEPWVAMAAVVALGQIGGEAAREALRLVAEDGFLGGAAREALKLASHAEGGG